MNKTSFKIIADTRRVFFFTASVAALGLSACATSSKPSLPVQGEGKSGALSGVRTYEQNGKILVVGNARPTFPNSGSHVDVKLVAPGGRVVAEKTERLKLGHPQGSQARHGRDRFVASFSAEAVRGATSVVVTYHGGAHANCPAIRG